MSTERGNLAFNIIGVGGLALFFYASKKTTAPVQNMDRVLRATGAALLSTVALTETSSKPAKFALGATVFLGPELLSRGADGLGGLGDARHQLYSMPRRYWVPDPSKQEKNCYQNKAECLMRFAKYNARVIDNYSGMEHDESPAEFDAINVKHGLKGDNRVTNISQALWVSLPPGRPYCLDNIDIETLNQTSPALEDPEKIGFLVPDYAIIDRLNREQAEFFREQELEAKDRAAEQDAEPIPF